MKIELVDVVKPFNKDFNILNGITIVFTEPTVILGDSGCGKTTLLNVIAGVDKSYQGKILL